MKFVNILRGTKSESEPVVVPGYITPDDKPFTVIFRPLTGLEHEAAYTSARQRAQEKGVTEPREGDPVYDLAVMAFVLSLGCVDPDSSSDSRSLSFASGIEILSNMQPETIVYLHEHHERWQDQCSPYAHDFNADGLMEKVREVAGADGQASFMRMSPSTRLRYATSTARMLLLSLEVKSLPGQPSEKSGKTSKTKPKRR